MELNEFLPPKVIILFGGPGSGKGTQGALIQNNFDFTHLSIGDVLRELNDEETNLYYQQMSSDISTQLTHHYMLQIVLKNKMQEVGWNGGKFVLDGFHRKFDKYDLELFQQLNIIAIISLIPSNKKILEERLVKRYSNWKELDRGVELDWINRRMNIYEKETLENYEILKLNYSQKMYDICCDNSREEVYNEIRILMDKII